MAAAQQKKTAPKKEETEKKSPDQKGAEKDIINEKLFGKSHRTLKDIPPEQGLTNVKIRPNEVGNIPGMIEHWKMDIKRRHTEVNVWQKQSFLKRASELLKGKKLSPEATGEEIAKLHPTKNALDLVKKLKQNPSDMVSRLELVSIVAKSGRELPIEVYRTLLLQATVACSFDELSNVGLQNVLWIQDVYFTKLFYRSKGEVASLEDKVKSAEAQAQKNAYSLQARQLRTYVNEILRNMEIIKSYQKHTAKALENQAVYHATLDFDEFTAFLLEEETKKGGVEDKKREERRHNLIKKTSEILLLLRALPLLGDQVKRVGDSLKKLDPNDPVVFFMQAKAAMTDLIFKVSQYQAGERTDDVRQSIQDAFKNTYHLYGIATRKVGKLPKTKMEFTIFIEYASLIHYFYKVAKNTLGLPLPREWLQGVLLKALDMLQMAQETGQVQDLIMDLRKDLADEGFAA